MKSTVFKKLRLVYAESYIDQFTKIENLDCIKDLKCLEHITYHICKIKDYFQEYLEDQKDNLMVSWEDVEGLNYGWLFLKYSKIKVSKMLHNRLLEMQLKDSYYVRRDAIIYVIVVNGSTIDQFAYGKSLGAEFDSYV